MVQIGTNNEDEIGSPTVDAKGAVSGRDHRYNGTGANIKTSGENPVNRNGGRVRPADDRCRNGIRSRGNKACAAYNLNHLHLAYGFLQDRGQPFGVLKTAAFRRNHPSVSPPPHDLRADAGLESFKERQRDHQREDPKPKPNE